MCPERSLVLLGWRQPSAGSPRLANLLQLVVHFLLGTDGDQREQGVEDLQPPLTFAFAHAADAAMIVRDGFADYLAFRLGKDFGGVLDAVNGLRVQREGDSLGCHVLYHLPPYGRAKVTTIAPRPRGHPVAARFEAEVNQSEPRPSGSDSCHRPWKSRLRNLPVNRIPLAKDAVQRSQGDVLRVARSAEGERRARRLDPRRRIRSRRLETRNLQRHAPHARPARTHRQLLRE